MRPAVRLLALVALLLTVGATASATAAEGATRAQRIVQLARAELAKGVREIPDGSNKAPAIRRYVASTSPSWFGAPWCAYFVSYVSRRAGVPIGPSGRGLGYVPYIVTWARRTKRWRTRPRPGYLVTWPNHVGIVETVSRNGTMTTIEGNAANAVRRRYRRTSDAQGFVALAAGGRITPTPPALRRPPARKEAPLKARITFYPSSRVRVGDRLEVSANDSSGPVARVRWDFDGDGRFDDARGDTATMRVTRRGRFAVAVRVESASGRRAVARSEVTVLGPQAPTARLESRDTTSVGVPLTLDASRSRDPTGAGLTYEWDLEGDGTFVAGGAAAVLLASEPGVRQVAVRVRTPDGEVDETSRLVAVLAAPTVAVACAQSSVPTRTQVRCTVDTAGVVRRIKRTEWAVDDGGFSKGSASRTFSFPTAGVRTIRVTVTDVGGAVASAQVPLTVTSRPPVVALKVPAVVAVGTPAVLDASGSGDPDGPDDRVRVRWDVGGDGRWDGEGGRHTVTPSAAGPLVVVVEVRDVDGAAANTRTTLDVRAALAPAITVLTDDPRAGQDVLLSAADSAGGPFTRCEWDLDGNGRVDWRTDDCAAPVRATYRRAGTKSVTLTVVHGDGRRASTRTAVVVG